MFKWIADKLTGRKRMNPEIKAQWLADLRSGEFEQGHGRLTLVWDDESKKHCCLGVLCVRAVEAGIIDARKDEASGSIIYGKVVHRGGIAVNDFASGLLPDAVRDWAGLEEVNPLVPFGSAGSLPLADINDERGGSFNTIADLIERYL